MTDACQIVAQQIDDHDVFGEVFWAGKEVLLDTGIQGGLSGARTRAFDGTSLDATLANSEEALRRSTEDLEGTWVEVSGERSGIDGAEPVVYFDGGLRAEGEDTLGKIDLKDVAGVDVIDGAPDGGAIIFRRKVAPTKLGVGGIGKS